MTHAAPPFSAAAGRFGLAPGYRENPARAGDDPDYWTEPRIAASHSYQEPVYRWCRALLLRRGARSFLDVGCGTAAKVAGWIAPHCHDLTLIDRESSRALAARFVPSARFIGADLDALGTHLGRRFDLIVCADVLEHLRDPEICLRFLREHLAPDGRAVLSTPERDNLRGRGCLVSPHPDHVREWSAREFRGFVERCGFAVETQRLMPPERVSSVEGALARAFGRVALRRRWASCQALVCRDAGAP
ncbi:MAG TPA: class I SAM-dependent methyltransferase [Myxococcota bacterium]|nr:class I SAM-dependent methyltransferase [Myxococcota bacterium]